MTAKQVGQNSHINAEKLPVSVVIVNYNAGAILADCVAAVYDAAKEIIVVDNASTDSSLSELTARFSTDTRLKLIATGSNLGFAAGCNIGIAASTAPYILFLNPDCLPEKQSLRRMVQVLESNPQIGMTGGFLINPDGTEQGGGRRAIPTPWRAFVRASGLYRLNKYWPQLFFDFHLHRQPLPKAPVEAEAISGALMLVRRTAIDNVGNWDEGYFLHCEDLDWCMRFRQKGWKIIFVPDAPVIHHQGTCSRARPFFVAWHKHKGMLRFYRKFFRNNYSSILSGVIACGVWLRLSATLLFYSTRYLYKLLKFRDG
ncbi:glycosyltransferase family 2 protein [Nitrosomonas sp.]|uniref:glycosyltransferase family 2 protein n=1 Tax=Nitrosomonas sp. TaxID=42353 RepID=UPI00208C5A38|nr:glycosyltransferase family 2 protein [Nitrosomonas sp.]GJL74839.1 MAG: glycosyl transferase [Nitrosomonas sp.]